MRLRSILAGAGFLLAGLLLGYYFLTNGLRWIWIGFLAASLASLAGWRIYRISPATPWLVFQIGMAAYGISRGMPAPAMSVVCVAALAGWELILSCQNWKLDLTPARAAAQNRSYLGQLALTLLAGLLAAEICAVSELRIPFGVIALLVLVVLGGLYFSLRFLRSPGEDLAGPSE